ncbi:MAG: T9SS type A sorting domain-containing protein [Cloacibacterium sp.]
MKKIFTLLSVVALGTFANAQTEVVNETFSYTGALNDNGWVTHSGTAGQLKADGSVAKMVAGSSEDVNKAFSTAYTIEANKYNKIEYSLTVNVADATGLTTTGEYFMHLLNPAGASPSGTSYVARLYIKGSTTGYSLGVLNNGAVPTGGSVTPTYGTEVAYGTPSNVVLTYIVDNTIASPTNTATLQINSQPLLTNSTGTGTAPAAISGIAIREAGNATAGTGNVSIDNLIVKTYTPSTLSAIDFNKFKNNFVKNTIVTNEISFGEKANVKIYNVSGSLVKSASVEKNTSLNVSSLPKGIYVVTGEVNGQSVSQKIVKE